LEQFQWLVVKGAYLQNLDSNSIIVALRNPVDQVEYTDNFARDIASRESVNCSKQVDRMLSKWAPKKLVSDPSFKTPGSAELQNLLSLMREEKGEEAIENMTATVAEIMRSYSMYLRSYYANIISNTNQPIINSAQR